MINALIKACAMAVILLLIALGWLAGCQSFNTPPFTASSSVLPIEEVPFSHYQSAVRAWLSTHRHPVKFDLQEEVAMNTPFECGQGATRGILLVHGLGDSPFFFREIGDLLCEHGYWVRTLLLPGHGSQPGDMINARYKDWQRTVDFHVQQFASKVESLFLGGFSTGANLVTVSAGQRDDIAGLVLFSPAMLPKFFVTRATPWLTGLLPWPNVEPEDNPARYNSIAMQGFAAYQHSVDAVQHTLLTKQLTTPFFAVLAEGDSVVDVKQVATQLTERFVSEHNTLLWMGQPESTPSSAVTQAFPVLNQRVLAASHMSMLFSRKNRLYGPNGSVRICDNGQPDEVEKQCHTVNADKLWYGPWGQKGNGRIVARLTFNPYFDDMLAHLLTFLARTET